MKNVICLLVSMSIASCQLLLSNDELENAFTKVYKEGIWGFNSDGEGFSGDGSIAEKAEPYMQFLETFLNNRSIKSVVDAGCGDWTFSQHIHWGDIHYLGIDAVEHVIIKNKFKFSSPTIAFVKANFLNLDLPAADLLLCKDVLQHLPNKEITKFLTHLSLFKYCLLTNDVDPNTLSSKNTDIQVAEYRTLDLTAPPFNLKARKVLTYPCGPVLKQVLLIEN